MRKEFLELGVELGGERFVVREDQRRPLQLLDDVRHRERLARAGDAHQHLLGSTAAQAIDQFTNRLRLIAGRLERGVELELHQVSERSAVGCGLAGDVFLVG